MQKITTFLWFDHQAEEAANFYTSIFKNSRITNISNSGEQGPVFIVNFELDGQEFIALNGGPHDAFNDAISLYVNCESQAEVDELWEKLTDGGAEVQCGWLKDKFGVSWQIVPAAMSELMNSGDPERTQRVMAALLQMVKIDLAGLQRAYDAG